MEEKFRVFEGKIEVISMGFRVEMSWSDLWYWAIKKSVVIWFPRNFVIEV